MASNAITEVTDANFDSDVLKHDKPVLIDFLGRLVWPLPRHRPDRRGTCRRISG